MGVYEREILGFGTRLQSWQSFYPRENDTMVNPHWNDAGIRLAIVRLSPFTDVEESITHQLLFSTIKESLPNSFVDFAFMPSHRDQKLFSESAIPWPLGIRSTRPLREFDVLFFSISYVLETANIPFALERAGIPRLAADRKKSMPLLLVGGSSILLAQAALPYVDGMYFGECEASFPALAEILTKWTAASNPHQTGRDFLQALNPSVPGLYVPGQSEAQVARVPRDTYRNPRGTYPVLNGAQADTARLQISLGCPFRCSFCYEGFERKPYRDLAEPDLAGHAREIKNLTGARSIDVISFNFNTHRDLLELMEDFSRSFKYVHVMSQRLDILWRDATLLEAETIIGKRSFTLGIEGISQRIRRFFQKDLSGSAVHGIAKTLLRKGIKDLKLFYIISSRETEDDLTEFESFIKELATDVKIHGGARVLFSCGVLMVMPHTPLQYGGFSWNDKRARDISGRMQAMVESAGFEYRLALNTTDWTIAQFLAVASPEMAHQAIENLFLKGTAWIGTYHHQALTCLPPPEDRPSGGLDYQHPLGFVQGATYHQGLKETFLRLDAGLSEPIIPTVDQPPVSDSLSNKRPILDRLKSLELLKRSSSIIFIGLSVPQGLAGASPEWLGSWAWRQIRKRIQDMAPELIIDYPSQVLEAVELIHSAKIRSNETGPFWWGESVFALEIRQKSFADLLRKIPGIHLRSATDTAVNLKQLSVELTFSGCDTRSAHEKFQQFFKKLNVVFTAQKHDGIAYSYIIAPKTRNKSVVKEAVLQHLPGEKKLLSLQVNHRFPLGELMDCLKDIKGLEVEPVHIVTIEFNS